MQVRSGQRDMQKVNSAPAYFIQINTSTHSTLFYLTDMWAPMSSSTFVLHQARSSPPSNGGCLILEPSNLQCSVVSGSTTIHIQSEVATEGDAVGASRSARTLLSGPGTRCAARAGARVRRRWWRSPRSRIRCALSARGTCARSRSSSC